MKKVVVVCLAFAVSLSFSNRAQSQVKIGIFDDQQILGLMPGIQKVDTLLNKYVNDSLRTEYDYELSELKRKDSIFKRDSATMNPSLRSIMQKEITQHTYKVVNWQQYQQQMVQQKQQELLKPFLEKVYAALQEVITEQKYTHVLKPDAIVWVDPAKSSELSLRVLDKLRIPLPKEIQDQIKALVGTTSASKPAPAKTTPVKH